MRRVSVSRSGSTAAAAIRGGLSRSPSRPIHLSAQQHNPNNTNNRTFQTKSKDCSEALAPAARLPEADPEDVTPVRPRQNVKIAEILERRAKAGKLVALTAAGADSDMFKGPSVGKPKAKRWDHHLSEESRIREPCVLKQAAKHLKKPGLISLGGGLPCAEYFPFDSISLKVPRAPNFSEQAAHEHGETVTIGKYDIRDADGVYDLSVALNYHQAHGSAQLMRWVTEHTELVCDPPYADWQSVLTVGSTGALEQALRLLCDRGRGDSLLTEEYSFATAIETASPLGINVVGIPMDDQGLLPEAMDEMLTDWNPDERGGARKPHVLYTVPSGQNPTGATQGKQRREEIYRVCQKHDVYIIEDEPYYFLQMMPTAELAVESGVEEGGLEEEDVDQFLDSLIPTLLSMDVDGRVMRMDSFSKVVVPGSRLGWITASEQIIERYLRHAEVCNQGPSGFSQIILYKLLDEKWGHEGYLRWLMNLRKEYTKRRDTIVRACERHLPQEVVSWKPPAAGMFHWIRVDHTQHPDSSTKSILEIEEEIFNSCIAKGVLVGRGSWFRAEQDKPPTGLFFRTTFAAATPENMTEAIRRFGEAIRESYRMS
ncbi:PLP-dependent transferase [Diplogelasinospora grovesii]|uniref:aromatic-amino-acid transaminase n=1 Tax=Diplogelasinospora grovesii TaxID=303347 RepID=A0AAN6NFE2_9PEZI|nr:PLP-dependent transferase [Diplogelasinospora grovesii]